MLCRMEAELFQFGLVLVMASVFALAAVKLNQSTIAGYLLAGAVARFFLTPSEAFEFLSFLGAILLLFFVGLEFSISKVKSLGRKIILVGLVDLAVNFPLGVIVGILFNWSWLEVLFLGGIVYISSSAVISKLLIDAKCMDRRETKTVLGILIIEDIVMAVMLAVFASLAANPTLNAASIAFSIVKAILFCSVFIVFEKPIRALINRILDVQLKEIFLLETIGIIFIVSILANMIGLSEATGAFFIGSAMAETIHQKRIKKMLRPLGYFSASLFFLSFGLQVNILALTPKMILMVAVLIFVSIIGKLVTGFSTIPLEGLTASEAQNIGYSLFSRGEFSILIASLFITQVSDVAGIREIIAVYVFTLIIISTMLIKKYTKTCELN